MARVNKTQYAILGCLSIRSMSAYEIKQFIGKSITYFWSEREGQLYPTLKQLSKDKLVNFHEEDAQKAGKKKIYSITEMGETVFLRWLSKHVEHSTYRNELLLKTFFGSFQNPAANIDLITATKKEYETILRILIEKHQLLNNKVADKTRRIYVELCIDYGIKVLEAEINWCDSAIEKIKSLEVR